MRSIDRYVHENSKDWQRLDELVHQATRRRKRLEGDDVDELLVRYQQTSAHLSHVRTTYADPRLTGRLTRSVADARAIIYGSQARGSSGIRLFFSRTFPAAVWVARRHMLLSAVALLLPWLIVAVWIANSPSAVEALGPEALREAYLNEDFESYYSSAPAAQFSTEVLVNNIQVSFLAFITGIAWGILTLMLLVFNGANIGIAAGLFHDAGQATKFWGLILPHGLLEISAIIVAGGAGLRMGWAMIAPGDRPRAKALVDEAQRSVAIVIGLILVFIVAGLIEGFVTPSSLPTEARIVIGAAAFAAFWGYVLAYGPTAVRAGYTGSMRDDPAIARAAALGEE